MARIGLLAKLYRGPVGATATTEMKNVRDLNAPDERGEGDISSRGSEFELSVSTMRKLSIEWDINENEADADFVAIRDAYVNRAPIALKCISTAGGTGIDADFEITKFAKKEPLNGPITRDVAAKPTYVSRYPAPV